jgi:predicted outer membrane repeat protein
MRLHFTPATIFLILIGAWVWPENCQAAIRYVKTGGAGTAPYTSWATASNDLQAVINAASAGDEIWIAAGTYKPNRRADALTVITLTDRNNAFVLKNNVKIYGGFVGTETLLTQRNYNSNVVLLSGDIGTVGVTTDNCYHVVVCAGLAGTQTLLDGVTITRGNANAALLVPSITVNTHTINPRYGGAIYKISATVKFGNCSFNQCNASLLGAGVYELTANVNTTYSNCRIARNTCAGDGGGIYMDQSSARFDSCSFTQNVATGEGGGMYISGSGSPECSNSSISSNDASSNGAGVASYTSGVCSFLQVYITGNDAAVSGGGIYANNSPVKAVNCQITGNRAVSGAGMWNAFSDALLINCTIAANRATAQGGGMGNGSSNPAIQNCIIYGNTGVPATSNSLYNSSSTPVVSYSLVQGGYTGVANVNADPLFVSPANASSAPITTGNFQLQKCSPALNGGNNAYIPIAITNDLLGNNRIHYGIADMGAFELPLVLAVPDANGIVYVDITKTGNGNSWANAVTELADAMLAAQYNNSIQQIWVAKGTYYPRYSRNFQNLDCGMVNRNNSFVLTDNLRMYGGFAGGEADTAGRNFTLNQTILSGNINSLAVNADNCYSVLISNNNSGTVELNGFTVSDGNGPGAAGLECTTSNMLIGNCTFINNISSNTGAAIRFNASDASLEYCTFQSNAALLDGGAILNESSTLTIDKCFFTANSAKNGGAISSASNASLAVRNSTFQSNTAIIYGGAIYNSPTTSLLLTQSQLISNTASNGGALHVENGAAIPAIRNCSFRGNSATSHGGAACLHLNCVLRNNLFSGNYSADAGGALHLVGGPSYLISNCTLAANKAVTSGSAIYVDAGTVILSNSIFDLNDGPFEIAAASITASYTMAQTVYPGTGNLPTWPGSFFYSPPGSAAPFTTGDYHLARCNPAINAGNNAFLAVGHTHDLDSNKRIAFGTVDMGAYETHLAVPDAQGIVYVDSSQTTVVGTGKSWSDAVALLADAVKEAADNPDVKEIWVAKGTYKPLFNATDAFKYSLCSFAGRDVAFLLSSGIKIYGGFAGGETAVTQRNLSLNKTILSGDVGVANDSTDNAYHVAVAVNATDTILLDGLAISRGTTLNTATTATINSGTVRRDYGGGMAVLSAPIKLANCSITNNTASYQGGGIYAGSSFINASNCSFTQNRSQLGGGALYAIFSKLYISSGNFRNNLSSEGGAVNCNSSSSGRIVNAVFTGNEASFGGALSVTGTSLDVINTTIAGNNATNTGGGIFEKVGTYPLTLSNSIVWGNTASVSAPGIYPVTGNTAIRNSLVQNGYATGTNIVNLDPQFVLPEPAASAPTLLGDYRLQACSPGLNMGDNASVPVDNANDADSLTRIRFTTVDLGAYEKQDIDLANSTWKGINSNWNDKLNWCGGYVPSDTTQVVIPNTANQPVILAGNDNAVKNITLQNATSITVANTSRLSIYGSYVNNGASIANNGSWVMKGSATGELFPGTLGTITAMHNLEVDNPSGVTLNKSFGITGALTARNGIITLLNDTITLKSSATATARIDTVHSGGGFAYTGTGKFEIERFIPGHKAWRLLTAPVNAYQPIKADWQENQTNSTLTNSNLYPGFGTHISGPQTGSGFDFTNTNFPSMLEYNAATNSVAGIPNTNVLNLNYRPGYFLFLHGSRAYDLSLNNLGAVDNTVLRSRGSIRTGSITTAVAANGFTLIGNPYASAIDFNQIGKTNVGNKFTLWDPSRLGSYGYGGYVTFTRVGAVYVAAPAPSSAALNQYIQSGYAFFVEGTGTIGSLQFHETDKVSGSESVVFREAEAGVPSMRINLIRVGNSGTETLSDGTLAAFDASGNPALDELDAGKKLNDNQNIALQRQGKLLAIEVHPPILQSDTLFIATNGLQQRTYKLELIPEQLNRTGLQAFLWDEFLQLRTPLSLTDTSRYSFVATSDSLSYTNRFMILFETASAGPLPVVFQEITAGCQQGIRTVRFAVSGESNLNGYQVQQSVNGRQFSDVLRIPATAESGVHKTYSVQLPASSKEDMYYRIRSLEINGTSRFSDVVHARQCSEEGNITVQPNPVRNNRIQLYFRNQVPGNYQISLYDTHGQLVHRQSVYYSGNASPLIMQPGNVLAAGQYVLRIGIDHQTKITIPVLIN